jgi:hypothetical protein
MISVWRTIVWRQFGAAIDMLDNALRACPDELWRDQLWSDPSDRPENSQVWRVVFHALFWLDLYLSGAVEGFAPPAPFKMNAATQSAQLPDQPYTKDELQAYLIHCRRKCQTTLEAMTDETAQRRCHFDWGEIGFAELHLYNMRHVQEHAAQLSLFLGQRVGSAPDWEMEARSNPA